MKFLNKLVEKAKDDGIEGLVVGGVIRNNKGQYLILSRKADDFMGGIDELPSGKVESGEDLYQALVREVKEESNLDVEGIEAYLDFFDYLSQSGHKRRQYNFWVKVENFDNVILTEHDEAKWLNIDECNSNIKITPKTLFTLNVCEFNK